MISVKVACFDGGSVDRPRLLRVECEDDHWPTVARVPAGRRGLIDYYRLSGMTEPMRLPDGTAESLPHYRFAYRTRLQPLIPPHRHARRRAQDVMFG
jgi:hypothetical protein